MSKKVINLTLPIVEKEIDLLLEMYPHRLHQLRSANSDLRQELLAYILNRIPSVYKATSDGTAISSTCQNVRSLLSLERQRQIEALVFQGINYLTSAKHSDKVCA